LAEQVVEEDWGAVGGDFYDVFGGVGVGFFEEGDYGFVKRFACVVKDFGEAGLRGSEGVAELYQGFGYGAGGGAGEADDADPAAAGWGGDGYDRVFRFKFSHGEAGRGFSYGNGRKNIGVVEGGFCGGFCKKWGAERGFLMVKTWWMCGETWRENALRLGAKNMPRLSNLFSQTQASCQTRLLPLEVSLSRRKMMDISLLCARFCTYLNGDFIKLLDILASPVAIKVHKTYESSPAIPGHLPKSNYSGASDEDFESCSGSCGWKSRASRVCSNNYRHQ
jgi:hypothetical protein